MQVRKLSTAGRVIIEVGDIHNVEMLKVYALDYFELILRSAKNGFNLLCQRRLEL